MPPLQPLGPTPTRWAHQTRARWLPGHRLSSARLWRGWGRFLGTADNHGFSITSAGAAVGGSAVGAGRGLNRRCVDRGLLQIHMRAVVSMAREQGTCIRARQAVAAARSAAPLRPPTRFTLDLSAGELLQAGASTARVELASCEPSRQRLTSALHGTGDGTPRARHSGAARRAAQRRRWARLAAQQRVPLLGRNVRTRACAAARHSLQSAY